MLIKPQSASDAELKCRAVELLAYGVLPFEQWAHVFANPKLNDWPGLQAKAFSVWLPTMVDFLQGRNEIEAIEKELSNRKVVTDPLFPLVWGLALHFEGVLKLYSIEEQLFVRDRRLQNVHGRLQISLFEEHDVVVYDPGAGLTRHKLESKKYRELMQGFYADLGENSAKLLERLLKSDQFKELSDFYASKLRMTAHFGPLIQKLGVSAACGSQ